jgi:hypothetical protein
MYKMRTIQAIRNKTSLRKGRLGNCNSSLAKTATSPTTTEVMKSVEPMSSPKARPPLPDLMALNDPNTSGDPLPKAARVTPLIK